MRVKCLAILIIAFVLSVLTGCKSSQLENGNTTGEKSERTKMEFHFIKTSPYDSTSLHELLKAGPAVPITFWECFDDWGKLNEFVNVRGFIPPDEFDFDNHCMLITYGRKLAALECESSFPVGSHMLIVTFEEENQGDNLFVYQIERRDYLDALYFTGSPVNIMDGEGRVYGYNHITYLTRLEYYLRNKELIVKLGDGNSGLVHTSDYKKNEYDRIRENWIGLQVSCQECEEKFMLPDGTKIRMIEYQDGWRVLILDGETHVGEEVWASYDDICAMLM